MGNRIGRQELQVFVPCNHAVATVTYEIRTGAASHQREVRQYDECGHRQWTSLGQFDANGSNVTVTLADNASRQHHARHGLFWASFGVDAIRARCVASCDTERPPSTPTGLSITTSPHSNGSVLISLEWEAPEGPRADSYRIVYSLGDRHWSFDSRTNSHQVQATQDLTFGVAVSALNDAGESGAVRATVSTLLEAEPVPENPPSGDRVSLADPSDYEYGFDGCPMWPGDQWGMVQRQCTSYVAWRLHDAGIPFHNTRYNNNGAGQLPWSCTGWCGHKWGHAAQWDEAARAVGIAVDQEPRRGAVAQWTNTSTGHVAYVERVEDSGNTIVVSDSNGREIAAFALR